MASRRKAVPPAKSRQSRAEAASASYVVFISHSSQDTWIASIVAERVEALGARPWLDEKSLEGGDLVLEEIRRAIDACRELVVLVSPGSLASQWVPFEIGAAWGQRKRVTPVLVNVAAEALAPMRGVHAISINDLERYFRQLRARIEKEERA